ncbi:hypothetical protein Glove_521g17 [Diversispora epigaea]|uniref:Uncharacterized protein n=1 Tax=Diversispora epigaea TaxID=1348612 RepID=A0A397GH11_9GLOM|nr:hypothetical protein Glove_521g17 [Diversispora epigaea]
MNGGVIPANFHTKTTSKMLQLTSSLSLTNPKNRNIDTRRKRHARRNHPNDRQISTAYRPALGEKRKRRSGHLGKMGSITRRNSTAERKPFEITKLLTHQSNRSSNKHQLKRMETPSQNNKMEWKENTERNRPLKFSMELLQTATQQMKTIVKGVTQIAAEIDKCKENQQRYSEDQYISANM